MITAVGWGWHPNIHIQLLLYWYDLPHHTIAAKIKTWPTSNIFIFSNPSHSKASSQITSLRPFGASFGIIFPPGKLTKHRDSQDRSLWSELGNKPHPIYLFFGVKLEGFTDPNWGHFLKVFFKPALKWGLLKFLELCPGRYISANPLLQDRGHHTKKTWENGLSS